MGLSRSRTGVPTSLPHTRVALGAAAARDTHRQAGLAEFPGFAAVRAPLARC